ncbi:MAG: CPBP family intramembrane glutamic endopeptidase [Chitinophagaceae bacterium]
MQSYLKTRPVWVQLLLFIGMAFGVFLTLYLILGSILAQITGISLMQMAAADWSQPDPALLTMMRGMLLIQFLGLFVTPSLLFAYFSDPEPMQYIGLRQKGSAYYWILGVASLLLAIPLVQYTGELNRQIHFGEGMQQWMQSMEDSAAQQIKFLLGQNTVSNLFLNIIFIAFFAGVGEELFFRGVLQRLFIKSTKNPWLGILIAAAVFSAFHFQFFGFIPRFLLGIVLGAIYWYSGSLWPAMAAHFLYDAFFITLAYFYPQIIEQDELPFLGEAGLVMGALVSATIVMLLVWLMRKRSNVTYSDVYRDEEGNNNQKFTFED